MKISQTKNVRRITAPSCPHTDLACECAPPSNSYARDFEISGFKASEMRITSKRDEEATGRKRGRYLTVFCPFLSKMSDAEIKALTLALSLLLKDIIKSSGFEISKDLSVLVAGLGNRFITSDAIGPRSADNILATAHLNRESKGFHSIGTPDLSIISPGVSSQSGFDSFSIISSAAKAAHAHIIIAIDALASRSTERLCSTVQISDSGIHPGSGIGNHRTPITKESVGIPVIAIGIPTVISSATLIYDALEKASRAEISKDFSDILHSANGFFVSPGDSDTVCEIASSIIADAIEYALLEKLFI